MSHVIRKPPPKRWALGGGEMVDGSGSHQLAPKDSTRQAEQITDSSLQELLDRLDLRDKMKAWHTELRERLARAAVLVDLGWPHPGFKQLAVDVHQYNVACIEIATALAPKKQEGAA